VSSALPGRTARTAARGWAVTLVSAAVKARQTVIEVEFASWESVKANQTNHVTAMINASLLRMEVFALGVPVVALTTTIAPILDPCAIRVDVLVDMEEDPELLDQMD